MPKDMRPARDFYLINTALIRLYKLMDDENIELNTQVKLILILKTIVRLMIKCLKDESGRTEENSKIQVNKLRN